MPISTSRRKCFENGTDIRFRVDGKAFKFLEEATAFVTQGRKEPYFEPETVESVKEVTEEAPQKVCGKPAKCSAKPWHGSLRGWGPITREIE